MAAGADSHEHPASGPPCSHPLLLSQLAIPPEPGFQYLGSRVEHVLAARDGLLSELVTEALDLQQVCSLCQHLPGCAPADELFHGAW